MKERPILFSAPMVRAILEGRKTMTRRVIKNQSAGIRWGFSGWENGHGNPTPCPYGQPGDRLWVRETSAEVLEPDIPPGRPRGPEGYSVIPARPEWPSYVVYRADGEMPNVQWQYEGDSRPVPWTPSIFMPRRASRILLEVTAVRVERVQDISEEDAGREGMSDEYIRETFPPSECFRKPTAREAFRELWDSINAKRGYGWDANPWVWAIELRKVDA